MFLATAYTETPTAQSRRRNFCEHVRDGRLRPRKGKAARRSPFARLLQHGLAVSFRIASPSSSADGAARRRRCSRASWKGAIRPNSRSREKANFIAQGVHVGKNLRAGEARATFRSGKSFPATSRKPEVKARSRTKIEGVDEPERRTFLMANWSASSSRFASSKNSSATEQRECHRSHPGAERHGADSRRARALHLRISQPGAVAPLAARDLPAIDRDAFRRSCRIENAPGLPTRSKT